MVAGGTRTPIVRPRFAREADAYPVLEAELKARGLRWYHTHDSRRSVGGFPDYIIPVGRWLLPAELKRSGGELTVEQADWLLALLGPWRAPFAVDVEHLDELLRAIDNMKAGRLDDLGPTGFRSVMVLGDVRRWYVLGSACDGEVVRRAAQAAAGPPATPRPRRRRDTRRLPAGS